MRTYLAFNILPCFFNNTNFGQTLHSYYEYICDPVIYYVTQSIIHHADCLILLCTISVSQVMTNQNTYTFPAYQQTVTFIS
jgi:hypothetical protein